MAVGVGSSRPAHLPGRPATGMVHASGLLPKRVGSVWGPLHGSHLAEDEAGPENGDLMGRGGQDWPWSWGGPVMLPRRAFSLRSHLSAALGDALGGRLAHPRTGPPSAHVCISRAPCALQVVTEQKSEAQPVARPSQGLRQGLGVPDGPHRPWFCSDRP